LRFSKPFIVSLGGSQGNAAALSLSLHAITHVVY
jgi:hypothetical protein